MKRLVTVLTLWIWGIIGSTFASTDETAAVRTAVQEFFAACKAGDIDTLAKYLLP
jgi:hypothetical protein